MDKEGLSGPQGKERHGHGHIEHYRQLHRNQTQRGRRVCRCARPGFPCPRPEAPRGYGTPHRGARCLARIPLAGKTREVKDYLVIQIRDLAETAGGEAFVDAVRNGFSCPKNADITGFLRENAVDFARRHISVTHLVIDPADRSCVGYFTLAHKAFPICAGALSKSKARKIARFAKFDPRLGAYITSVFLIAQLGKNYAIDGGKRISGAALLQLAFDELKLAEREIGGEIVFAECTAGNKVLEAFYERNGFFRAGRRVSESDGHAYTQYLAFLK